MVVHGGRRDQGRRRLRSAQGLLRGLRRQRVRARRPHREARLEGGRGELDRARPRPVLCEPGDRLRPCVHRGHRRRRVRVRRRHRRASLGAGHGRICLRLGRDLERDGLRRLLRSPLLRPRCRDGRGALVVLGQRPDLRVGDRDGRDRLLLDAPQPDLRARCDDRQAGVDAPRRPVQPARGRAAPRVFRRPRPDLRVRSAQEAARPHPTHRADSVRGLARLDP